MTDHRADVIGHICPCEHDSRYAGPCAFGDICPGDDPMGYWMQGDWFEQAMARARARASTINLPVDPRSDSLPAMEPCDNVVAFKHRGGPRA